MFPIIAMIAASVAMYRIAAMSDIAPTKWAVITFGLCFILSLVIPFPFGGLLVGFPVSYGLMVYSSMKTA